jgi:hypothetical protein
MSGRPSRIRAAISFELSRPRDRRLKRSPRFNEYVDEIAELVMQTPSDRTDASVVEAAQRASF